MRRWLIGLFLLALAVPAAAQTSTNNRTPTDCSGTITSGGTAQTLIAANTGVGGFVLMNIDTSEPLWISFTGTAAASTTGSFAVPAATATTFAGAGSFYSGVGFNHAITIIGATTSHKFSCTRW